MLVSVIMINRNGARDLPHVLNSCLPDLAALVGEREFGGEFVFVDNASTDDSIEVATRFLSAASVPYRIVKEEKLGVNYARNAGIDAALGHLLVFVDSDLTFEPGWLRAIAGAAERQPSVSVFAGRVTVGRVDGDVPDWLALSGPHCRTSIVVQLNLGSHPAVLQITGDAGPVGPLMAFRRDLFEKVGRFDWRFGLRPGSLVPGAESEFFDRLMRRGERFAWVPTSVVSHPIRASQMSKQYFVRRMHGIGRASARVAWIRSDPANRTLGLTHYRIRELAIAVLRTASAVLRRSAPTVTFYHVCNVAMLAGYLREDFLLWKAQRVSPPGHLTSSPR